MLHDGGDALRVAVIWVDVLPSDDAAAAGRAQVLIDDERVTHFHDPDKLAGRAWAGGLGLVDLAWDVYLLFEPDARWSDPAPAPFEWFHQLGGDLADPARRRTAHSLAAALHDAGATAGWPMATDAPSSSAWQGARESALLRLQDAGSDSDGRCSECRAAGRLSSCSLGGWRRLVLRMEDDIRFTASGTQAAGDTNGRREILLTVSGMRCSECMLRAGTGAVVVEGVEEVEVVLDDGTIRVLMKPGSSATADDVAASVRDQGFAVP